MELLSKWRDKSGVVLRKEFEDAIAKAPCAQAPARSAFLHTIAHTHETLLTLCSGASSSERAAILRCAKCAARKMWREGVWPLALGFEIASLSVASRFVSDADAVYVRRESNKIVEEAMWSTGAAPTGGGGEIHALVGSLSSPGQKGRARLRQLAIEVRQIKQAAFARIADQALQLSRDVGR